MKNNTRIIKYMWTSHIFHINFTKSVWLSLDVSKSTDRMANSVDPDQTAPIGAVWSGSTLFAQTYLT